MSHDDAKRILLLNLQAKPCLCCAASILVEVPLVMRVSGTRYVCRNRCGWYRWRGSEFLEDDGVDSILGWVGWAWHSNPNRRVQPLALMKRP